MHFDVKAQDRCTLIEAQYPSTSVEAQIRAMLCCTRCTNIEEQDNCPAIDDQHQLGNGKTDIDMEIMTEQDSELRWIYQSPQNHDALQNYYNMLQQVVNNQTNARCVESHFLEFPTQESIYVHTLVTNHMNARCVE